MRSHLLLFLLCACSYGADNKSRETSEVTSQVFERDLNGGKTHYRIETFFRGKTRVLRVFRKTEAGVTTTTRSYEVGDIMVIEGDELLIVENTKTNQLEMFSRQPDGSVRPVDAKTLALTKEEFEEMSKFWTKAFDKSTDVHNFVESGKALREKLKELEKAKTKEQK
jgi:hypothetical protein